MEPSQDARAPFFNKWQHETTYAPGAFIFSSLRDIFCIRVVLERIENYCAMLLRGGDTDMEVRISRINKVFKMNQIIFGATQKVAPHENNAVFPKNLCSC